MSEIDRLTLCDVKEMFEYWQEYPPTHVLVRAYLMGGAGSSSRKNGKKKSGGLVAEIKQAVLAVGGELKKVLPDAYRVK